MKIYPKEIIAYQTPGYYAVSQEIFAAGRKTHISVDCLPGFGIRIARGKINVYCKKYYNGSHAIDEFFLQAGDDGKIIAYTPEVMNEMVKNHVEATGFFTKKTKNAELAKKILAMAYIVNNEPLISKN